MLHFAKNVSKNSNLDDSRISFPSRTSLKLYTVTPRLVKKVITDLHSWKASGPELFILFIYLIRYFQSIKRIGLYSRGGSK